MRDFKGFIKRTSLIIIAMVLVFNLTGCGSKTLEDVVKNDTEVKQTIENLAIEGMEYEVDENQITYTYTYDKTFDKETLKTVKSQLKKIMDNTGSIFKSMVKEIEKESDIDGVTIVLRYNNGDGTPLYENEYK